MKKKSLKQLIFASIMFWILGFASVVQAKIVALPIVTILADTSLILPLTEISRIYSREHKVQISAAFASSKEQLLNIEAGVEADIFITPKAKWIKRLKSQGMVNVYSGADIASNRLALVGNSNFEDLQITLIKNLPLHSILKNIDDDYIFVVGDPEYMTQGSFALEGMKSYNLNSDMEENTLFIPNLIDMYRSIEINNAFGIMYLTDAKRNSNVQVLDVFPENTYSEIIYKAEIIAGGEMEAARSFLKFIKNNNKSAKIFTKYGFGKPPVEKTVN